MFHLFYPPEPWMELNQTLHTRSTPNKAKQSIPHPPPVETRQRIASLERYINLSVNGISLNKVEHTKFLGDHID